jgi:thiamine-monophosphate kinase
MSESEFDIIRNYFSNIGNPPDWLVAGVGDDAAIVTPDPEQQLLIAVDTLNVGIHFPANTSAEDIGYKSLAVNVSDIAAMGGQPLWFTLALSLPEIDHDWLRGFASGLSEMAGHYNLVLVGGDTTKGPLSITIQIAGGVERGKALCRSGAKTGDDIYVTGTLGDAAGGLQFIKQDLEEYTPHQQSLVKSLHRPTPRVEIGKLLSGQATACIDISDGLAADLGHILEASSDNDKVLGAEINLESIPLSESLKQSGLELEKQYNLAMYGGDDYELCFTAPSSQRDAMESLGQQVDCRINRIGIVTGKPGLVVVDKQQKKDLTMKGYDHFASP